MHFTSFRPILLFLFMLPLFVNAQQKMDEEYAKLIKEFTTSPDYLSPLVDHLPLAEGIPTPLAHFGQIIGAPDKLHYTSEIHAYMRRLEEASPRVKVRSMGKTEEGREMIEVIVADEKTLNNLDEYRGYLKEMADPRKLDDQKAQEIIEKAKPIYYFTAGLHSPETGPPEMVMELAYRLAVGESDLIKRIRENIITVILPVTEPDGRDRQVDVYKWRDANGDATPNLTYWGHYVAHDNNRDGYGLGLNLTRNILDSYMYWTPTVLHDLHESVPYLYVQTGKGPYNPYNDATLVDEWNKLAYNDVDALTRRDMPGVWTWGFFNGWAANYMAWIANNRNSVGRFYETFGNSVPQTLERKLGENATSREWYRMNPPLEKTTWSLRNNTNYMQTGVLATLDYAAIHKNEFLENFYYRSKKAVEKGNNEAPYAFVLPKKQKRDLANKRFVNLLLKNGIEVGQTDGNIQWKEGENEKNLEGGAYVIKMNQPYRTLIGTLMDKQEFPKNYDPPYDDVGWTLPYLYGLESFKIEDNSILDLQTNLLTEEIKPEGKIENSGSRFYLINNTTDDEVGRLRLQLADIAMNVAEEDFAVDDATFRAGTLIVEAGKISAANRKKVEDKAKELGLTLHGVSELPEVANHKVDVPKIALVHSWMTTPQNEGWWRLAFDQMGIPYKYISFQTFRKMKPNDFDVIVIPDTYDTAADLLSGAEAGPALPWKKTKLTPNLGLIDETEDQGMGMGYEGAANLKKFLDAGGVVITDAGSSNILIDLGITRHVKVKQTQKLETHGSVFNAKVTDSKSPITYGYKDNIPVYFNQRPVFEADTTLTSNFFNRDYLTPDAIKDERWAKGYPRVVMRFDSNSKDLLLSGMLRGGDELAGKPVIVDVPVGNGHVVMFANRSFWRLTTHGSHSLVLNTLINWKNLRIGWPERPKDD